MPLINDIFNKQNKSKNHVLIFRSNEGKDLNEDRQHIYYSGKKFEEFSASFTSLSQHKIQSAYVTRTDEKGTDVNLATNLLYDAFKGDFETAVIISNDSDLYETIRLSMTFGKKIGIINPQKKTTSKKLTSLKGVFIKQIREGVLSQSQFPEIMSDKNGKFSKPKNW